MSEIISALLKIYNLYIKTLYFKDKNKYIIIHTTYSAQEINAPANSSAFSQIPNKVNGAWL